MTERPADLVYGHLGDPTYDGETQEWFFPRIASSPWHIVALGSPNIALEASVDYPKSIKQNENDRHHHARDIVKYYPELTPALDISLSNVLASEAVIDIITSHEPTASELLDFGIASNATSSQHVDKIPIAAVVTGSSRELVQFILLRRGYLGWNGNGTFGIHHLTAINGEKGWWRASGGPIRQICFATNDEGEGGSSVAVRYQGAISILHPILRQELVSTNQNSMQSFLLPASRLDPHEIVNIRAQDLSSMPFADVSFNPWNQKQIAAIDQAGAWTVLELEARMSIQKSCRFNIICNGCLDTAANSASPHNLFDGWARILWINDFRMLLVASRRSMDLVMIGTNLKERDLPDLNLTQSTDWILDIKRVPGKPAHIFLVTSTRLFWLEATIIDDIENTRDFKASLTILLCWVHYRSPDDTSICINVITEDQQEENKDNVLIKVLSYSRIIDLILMFSFKYIPSQKRAMSIADPHMIPISHEHNLLEGSSLLTLVLQPLPCSSHSHTTAPGSVVNSMDQGTRFYQLNLLSANLALNEGLYAISPQVLANLQEPDVRAFRKEPEKPSKCEDGFIVQDALAHEVYLSMENDRTSRDYSLSSLKLPKKDLRTINWEWLIKLLHSPVAGFENSHQASIRSKGEAVEIIIATLERDELEETPSIQTLFDLIPDGTSIGDINDIDALLNAYDRKSSSKDQSNTDSINIGDFSSLSVQPIFTSAMQTLFNIPIEDGLRPIYDSLVRGFISPLPFEVPSRIRVMVDKSLQNVALQLFLASRTVRPLAFADKDDNRPEAVTETRADLTFDLPVRRKASSSSQARKGNEKASQRSSSPAVSSRFTQSAHSFRVSSQQSNHSTVRSNISSNRSESLISTAIPSEDTASQRLRSITTLTPQPTLPNALSSILSHWTVGTDPATYDWAATQRALAIAAEGEEQAESSKSKKSKRKKRRLQKSIEDWSAGRPLRDRAVAGGSQPMPVLLTGIQPLDVVSSGQTVTTQEGEALPMSQPLPGPHGTSKQNVKKKKRKEGF